MSNLSLVAIQTILIDHYKSFKSKELTGYVPAFTRKGNPILRKGAQCGVAKIHNSNNEFKALRLWLNENSDSLNIYNYISIYVKRNPAKYLLHTVYLQNAIKFNDEFHHALLMDWCGGVTMKDYLIQIKEHGIKLQSLLKNIEEMFRDMNQRRISHGDIHHNNIMVSSGGTPVLIDYDSMFTPNMPINIKETCLGYSGYQHPIARQNNKYLNSKVDYFSQLIIIMTIECLIEDSTLWERYFNDDEVVCLIFKAKDFENLEESGIYRDLISIKRPKTSIQNHLEILKDYLKKKKIDDLYPYYQGNNQNRHSRKLVFNFCMNCGKKIYNSGDVFCINCGFRLKGILKQG